MDRQKKETARHATNLRTKRPDNIFALSDLECCEVVSILPEEESGPKMLLCRVYGHLEPYFMEPCDSRLVGIYKAQISQTRMKKLPEELLPTDNHFAIIKFELDSTVDAVPSIWLDKTTEAVFCYWPRKNVSVRVKKKEIPDKGSWQRYKVSILGYAENYGEARKKVKLATVSSNLESDDEEPFRRTILKPSRYRLDCDDEACRRTHAKVLEKIFEELISDTLKFAPHRRDQVSDQSHHSISRNPLRPLRSSYRKWKLTWRILKMS
ncbi:unnamed protein product [Leuciscus chuanchicus]